MLAFAQRAVLRTVAAGRKSLQYENTAAARQVLEKARSFAGEWCCTMGDACRLKAALKRSTGRASLQLDVALLPRHLPAVKRLFFVHQ